MVGCLICVDGFLTVFFSHYFGLLPFILPFYFFVQFFDLILVLIDWYWSGLVSICFSCNFCAVFRLRPRGARQEGIQVFVMHRCFSACCLSEDEVALVLTMVVVFC